MFELNGDFETVDYSNSNVIRFYRNTNTLNFCSHWHQAVEIIQPIENWYKLHIGEEDYLLEEKDFILITSGTLHAISSPPEGGARFIMNFRSEIDSSLKDLAFLTTSIGSHIIIRHKDYPETTDQLFCLLSHLEILYAENDPFAESSILSDLLQLLILVGRHYLSLETTEQTLKKSDSYTSRFVSICNYIQAHCCENLTLEQVAQVSGFSKYHFCRLFQEATNSSFHDYLASCRIRLAKNLMTDSTHSVTEIALKSGFSSLSTFNRTFKQHIGCTPTKYRALRTPNHMET